MKKLFIFLTFILASNLIYGQAPSLKGWHHMDLATDSVPGISSNKAYADLLEGRKSVPVVVAVIDGGVDYKHEDLKDIMWHNPGEIAGDGIDNDKNGYVDDIYGWNFIGGKDGKNVNYDNLEVTRLYRKYDYKYKNADPAKLNKKQKKEYDFYLKVKEEVEKQKKDAAEKLDNIKSRKKSLMDLIDGVAEALQKDSLSFSQIDSLNADDNPSLAAGIGMIKQISMQNPDIDSIDKLKKYIDKAFQRGFDYYSEKILYQYNPDFDPRDIVGDNYEDSSERYYGNNDVKGP
ncbi:MAG TPA: peptidase S8, partial [Bacteroidetes bacterium]|nr:peptidase S8 [Bacteroidota bacterium]